MTLLKCPTCHGSGIIYAYEIEGGPAGPSGDCRDCEGRGRLLPPEALQAVINGFKDADHEEPFATQYAEAAVWAFIDALPGDTNE